MGKGSQAPDLSSSQVNSAMAGLQSARPQSLGISTGMDAIPSMNSQWAGRNTQPGYGDDMRFPGKDAPDGGLTTGWQPPDQMQPYRGPDSGGLQIAPWGQQPPPAGGSGSTGASAALNILNGTQAGQPGAQPPAQPGQPGMWGQRRPNWGMKQRQGGWNQPIATTNSGGLQASLGSGDPPITP